MEEKKIFYLIDGSSYLYRAFYGLKRLTNSRGMPTHAIYGFAQMLLKVIRDKKPNYVCAVFDTPHPTFRHDMYEPYKATRQKAPEDLGVQIPYIKDLLRYHGIPQMEMAGYEADDLIAALTHRAREEGLYVVIVSGDKDLHQLIDEPYIVQWDAQRDKVITAQGVEDRFGIKPSQMRDYLSLVGDASDNVPGVPGVGEKTATKLLKEWGSLDELLNHIAEVSPASLRTKLDANRDLALLSRNLVSFKDNLPASFRPEDFVLGSTQRPELMKLYEELEFKSFLEALRKEQGAEAAAVVSSGMVKCARTDRIITNMEEFDDLIGRLEREERFSVDLETTSQDSMQAKLVGVALSWEDHRGFYVPVGHTGPNSERQLPESAVLEKLRPLLSRIEQGKVGQNLKYEWVVFKRHGIALRGIEFDTMVASYLLSPGGHSHKLERVSAEHLNEEMISYTDVTGKGRDQIGFSEVDVNRAAEYACEDAEITWRLAPVLHKKLRDLGLENLYRQLELPLIEVLAEMEYKGVLVDTAGFEALSLDLEKAMEQKADIIYRMAGGELNIQSPKQLAAVLFDKLGLPVMKKTKSGPSTDMNVLEDLAAEHPIAEQVLAYRSLAKLKGTYVDSLPKLIHPETGRIHTSYNQTVTATGRLSSSNPNLQNIPIRSEEGRKIREAFIPAPGHVLLSADYSQIELRILAHYSQDPRLIEAFRRGEDIHQRTAAEMFSISPQQVNAEMRRQAKTINFGIIYGMGAFGLARQLRTSNAKAKKAIERYFQQYSGVKRFTEEIVSGACERGYCETLLGRIRLIPELQSRNRTVRQQGERLAINTTIQGTAADLIKKAMIDIHQDLEDKGLMTAMILQVHDELVFEVPEAELVAVRDMVREKMEEVWPLDVPLRVDMGWGNNWAAAHP